MKRIEEEKGILDQEKKDKMQHDTSLPSFNHVHNHLNLGMTNTPMLTHV